MSIEAFPHIISAAVDLQLLVVWHWGWWSILSPYLNDVVDDNPGVISSSKDSVHIFGSNVDYMVERCSRLFII